MPRGDVLLESPPEIPPPKSGGNFRNILMMLPMLAGAGAMAMMMTSGGMHGGRGPLGAVMGGMYGISMLGMMLTQLGRGNDDQAQQLDMERRNYFRYLGQMRERVRETAGEQRAATMWIHPDPEGLWAVAGTRRMWERRVADDDFASIRIGLGQQAFVQRIMPPESKPIDDLEPLTVGALRRFMATHRRVPTMPISVDVRSYERVVITGDADRARRLGYAMVTQLATWHAPTDLRLLFCIDPEASSAWDWAKWLPHAQHPERTDGLGAVRLMATDPADLGRLAEGAAGASQDEPPSQVVVVDEGIEGMSVTPFSGPSTRVTSLHITSGDPPRRISPRTVVLHVNEAGHLSVHLRREGGVRVSDIGPADQIAMVNAEMCARALAGWRMPDKVVEPDEVEEVAVVEEPVDWPTQLGVPDPLAIDTNQAWRPRTLHNRLRISIGNTPTGQPVELDIKEAAMNGMGPHGLCIGATGSGKSEFLRTLVLGLAMTHPPDQLNYVLVDFKGGATFAGLDELPHTSAVITNLEGELALVDRMQDAIGGELDRRMEALASANAALKNRDIKNREEYDQARLDGADLEPMPSLFIVVDEFSELLTARPEFINLFIQIGRIGRSIGVHLLLASQRLEEGKLRGLDTFLSYRVALRTFSAAESRTVIGVPDAYELPSAPGNGYLKYDTTSMTQFKAAYVSGPWVPTNTPTRVQSRRYEDVEEPLGESTWVPPVMEFTAEYQPEIEPPKPETVIDRTGFPDLDAELAEAEQADDAARKGTKSKPKDDDEEETLLSLVVNQLEGQGWPAHKVWLPPLDEPFSLDQLLVHGLGEGGRLVTGPRGLNVADTRVHGRLQTPVGLVDRPRQQRRDPLWLDFSGAGGNLAVAGGPQAGKSTALRTAMMSLALTHTPQEVGFYALDFGGGAMMSLRDAPHVGSVCGRLDVDRVKRTIAEMNSLVTSREREFLDLGVESMRAYRRGRADGSIRPDRFPTDVFLIIDGWQTLKDDFNALEATITQIAQRGLGFGVHVWGSVSKWQELRMGIRDQFQSKIELKLGDAFDSDFNRKWQANVPAGRPGRGINDEGLHMLLGVPRADDSSDAETLAEGVRDMVTSMASAWPGEKAAEVRMLPLNLEPKELPAIAWDEHDKSIPIAIDELELAPVLFDTMAEPHMVLYGAPESGKSTVIRTILKGIEARYKPSEAMVFLVDYRRSHLGLLPDDYLIGYAASESAVTKTGQQLIEAVKARLPGANVTQEELRNRSWWTGLEVFVVVDDYELVATQMNNPLRDLGGLIPQARDIGLHVIIARGMGGAGRAGYSDPLISRMRDMQSPGLIMSGSKEEGALLGGVKPSELPEGRGTWVTRYGTVLIQTVNTPDPSAS